MADSERRVSVPPAGTPAPADLDVIERCLAWGDAGHGQTLVTVVSTFGSSPRPVGSMAVVRDDGQLFGSVSGGCVEKRLAERFTGQAGGVVAPIEIDDTEARRFGLTCGGRLELLFERPIDITALRAVRDALRRRRRVIREVDLESGEVRIVDAHNEVESRVDGTILRQVFGPLWRLMLIGAGQLSRYVAGFATAVDFDVHVCDPREPFRAGWPIPAISVDTRFPDEAVAALAMDARSGVLALTHDPTLDDPALEQALGGKAFYVGALGSRRSHARRLERLTFLGVGKTSLERIRAPIGLSIGSRTAAEIAISIMAEAVRERARSLVE